MLSGVVPVQASAEGMAPLQRQNSAAAAAAQLAVDDGQQDLDTGLDAGLEGGGTDEEDTEGGGGAAEERERCPSRAVPYFLKVRAATCAGPPLTPVSVSCPAAGSGGVLLLVAEAVTARPAAPARRLTSLSARLASSPAT